MITRETLMLHVMVGYSTLASAPLSQKIATLLEEELEKLPGVQRAIVNVSLSKLEGEQAPRTTSPMEGKKLVKRGDGPWWISDKDGNPLEWPAIFPQPTELHSDQASALARALGMSVTTLPR